MAVKLRRNRRQRGASVVYVNLCQRRRCRRFNQERSGASMLRFADELMPVEFSASQCRKQISGLDKPGIVDDS
jgi:hypothetical protein